MNDEQAEKQQKRIDALKEWWLVPLGLDRWRLIWLYERTCNAQDRDGESTMMQVRILWEYYRATITVYLPALEDTDDEELEWAFVHDMSHILTHECRDHVPDQQSHAERVCCDLAAAFRRVRDKGRAELVT